MIRLVSLVGFVSLNHVSSWTYAKLVPRFGRRRGVGVWGGVGWGGGFSLLSSLLFSALLLSK